VENNVHTTAERVLQLLIVSSSRLCFELETRFQASKTSFLALGAKYTICGWILAGVGQNTHNEIGIVGVQKLI
jgi:hypothetical protein